MSNTSLKTIAERVALKLAGGNTPVNATATGGDTTSFISTSASINKTSTTAYNGVQVLITSNANSAGNAPEGEVGTITSFDSGTSDWTVTAVSANIETSDTATFIYKLSWEAVLDCINDIVRGLPVQRWLPLSLCTDGDMENSAASDYNAVAGGTLSKVSAAANTLLRRSLRIQGAGDGQGARSDPINVHEGETLSFSIALRCDTGTAQIEIYDEDAAAVISGESYTTDEEGFVEVRWQWNVDADVERISVQITQDGATALDAYVGWVSVLSNQRSIYDLPSVVTSASSIESIDYLPKGENFELDSYRLFSRELQGWPHTGDIVDKLGANPNRIQIQRPWIEAPLFLKFRATETALSAQTDTLFLQNDDMEAFYAGVEGRIYDRLAKQAESNGNLDQAFTYKSEARQANGTYNNYIRALNLVNRKVKPRTQSRVRV